MELAGRPQGLQEITDLRLLKSLLQGLPKLPALLRRSVPMVLLQGLQWLPEGLPQKPCHRTYKSSLSFPSEIIDVQVAHLELA